MTDFRDFRGAARPLDDIDLPRLGHRIGVGEDEIHAVIDVETAGGPWDARGRPKMLFEPHRFYKLLGPGAKRDRAVAAGLAYPRWGEKKYPADSYPRLLEAMKIDETVALMSASWGLGQIMGDNHELIGYDTPQDMVVDFLDDADKHLEAMVAFILATKIDGALRAHDWKTFARRYNGPQYATHGYHTKLAAAYQRWSRIRDTPWSPSDPYGTGGVVADAAGELVLEGGPVTSVGASTGDVVVSVPKPEAQPDTTAVVTVEPGPPAKVEVTPVDLPPPSTSAADLRRYSKMIGSLVGVLVGWAVGQSLVPDSLASVLTPQNIDLLSVTLGGMVGTFLAPANAPVVKKGTSA